MDHHREPPPPGDSPSTARATTGSLRTRHSIDHTVGDTDTVSREAREHVTTTRDVRYRHSGVTPCEMVRSPAMKHLLLVALIAACGARDHDVMIATVPVAAFE